MISVQEAISLIQKNCKPLGIEKRKVYSSLGFFLASDIFSPISLPPFNQSAMDGFAFNFDEYQNNKLLVENEIAAGDKTQQLKSGTAIRIYTGAPIPIGADTVVMQEKVEIENNILIIHDEQLKQGSNIRSVGEQVKNGEKVLEKGQLLTPATLSFIASLGINEIAVFIKPKVAIVVTGNELQQPGLLLKDGQVFESNSTALLQVLKAMYIDDVAVFIVPDDEKLITETFNKLLHQNKVDVLLVSGGVSVGKYDYVANCLQKSGVQKVFHKIKQKPGKPLYFGVLNNQLVFGLPGNPGSAFTCFYEYVYPAIQQLQYSKQPFLKKIFLPLSGNFTKKIGLTHFLKGKLFERGVMMMSHQESYKMNSFAESDCLIKIPEETENIIDGELVEVHLLPM